MNTYNNIFLSAINNLLILLFVVYKTQIHNNYLRVFLNFFGIIEPLKVMLRFSKIDKNTSLLNSVCYLVVYCMNSILRLTVGIKDEL